MKIVGFPKHRNKLFVVFGSEKAVYSELVPFSMNGYFFRSELFKWDTENVPREVTVVTLAGEFKSTGEIDWLVPGVHTPVPAKRQLALRIEAPSEPFVVIDAPKTFIWGENLEFPETKWEDLDMKGKLFFRNTSKVLED